MVSQVRHLPANHLATVPVQITDVKGTILLEPSKSLKQTLQVEESYFEVKVVLQQ